MGLVITHNKISTKQDGADPSKVLPSDWNDEHNIEGDILEGPIDVNILKELVYLPQDVNTPIISGDEGKLFVAPDVGQIGSVNSMYVNIPAVSGASSGSHVLYIAAGTTNAGAMLQISSPYNQPITIEGLSVINGSSIPADEGSVAFCLSNLIFDHLIPLYLKYENNTNHTQSAARTYNVMYILEGEETASS